jgi:molybdopterin synthase sulfur carrier subunit
MAVVRVPSLMRDLTGGQEQISASGKTVGEVVAALDEAFPGIKGRLCVGEQIDPALAVFVDGEIARLGLLAPVKNDSEIHFLPAIAGG